MSAHHNGGAAFPTYDINGVGERVLSDFGLTKREWFAAHAPAEPQPWFRPVMSKERPKALRADNAYPGDLPLNAREIGDWERDLHKETLLQWPLAWADEMIARSAR